MQRLTILSLTLLLPACFVQKLEDILANHESSGWPTSTGETDTSTGTGSTTGTAEPDTTSTTDDTTTSSTGGAEAGMDASGDSSTSTSTDASASSTGPTPPVCGDGILDPGEECDDGNADPMDGCKDCARDRFIFASSVTYQGGKLGGLYGADQRCRMLAAVAMLPNFATYRAWLSDSKVSAADRLQHHRGRYLLVNGLVVAMDWDDLTNGSLLNPITVNEHSETSDDSRSWTGTLASGQPALGSSFCFDWTDDASMWDHEEGGSGIRMQSDALWSYYQQLDCGSTAGLYCIEQ